MQTDGCITRAELARQIGKGRATLVRWEESGLIPAARRVSKRRSLYGPAEARAVRIFAGAAQ
jgi:DNA-binding transcriptional MerR regulator